MTTATQRETPNFGRDKFGRCEVCGAPGFTMMFENFVPIGRQIWHCGEHKPDYRALRIAYFETNGQWPPIPSSAEIAEALKAMREGAKP